MTAAAIIDKRARRHARSTARPAVVVRAVPALDPPFEETITRPAPQPPADMDFLPEPFLSTPEAAPRADPPDLPRRSANAHAAAQRFVGMCVEVLNGYRPIAQLRPLTHPKCFTEISDQLTRRTVRVRMPPGQAARHGRLVRARRMLLGEPVPGVVEAAVVLEQGDATWAMAVRLERSQQPGQGVLGWQCTVVQVV